MATVYPRACGGTLDGIRITSHIVGLSPRLRGNLGSIDWPPCHLRSIPAPAGEPVLPSPARRAYWVYPRACGGTPIIAVIVVVVLGLSPRLRGNRSPCGWRLRHDGSIPAPAGEPSAAAAFRCRRTVYPRACGGTTSTVPPSLQLTGLSPRLRGNRGGGAGGAAGIGSIPAPAGEPLSNGA